MLFMSTKESRLLRATQSRQPLAILASASDLSHPSYMPKRFSQFLKRIKVLKPLQDRVTLSFLAVYVIVIESNVLYMCEHLCGTEEYKSRLEPVDSDY